MNRYEERTQNEPKTLRVSSYSDAGQIKAWVQIQLQLPLLSSKKRYRSIANEEY